jgi:hypothetical protein
MVRQGNAIVGSKDSDLSGHLAVVAKGFQLCRVYHCVSHREGRSSHEEERAENKIREGHLEKPCVLEIMWALTRLCDKVKEFCCWDKSKMDAGAKIFQKAVPECGEELLLYRYIDITEAWLMIDLPPWHSRK